MVERTLISFASQLQLIERLQHMIYLSSSVVFISGEQGSGKSTLIEQLSNQLPSTTQQAFINLTEPHSVAQIRQKILSQLFENPLFNSEDNLFNSWALLSQQQGASISRVVVIDNAQRLPDALLHELFTVVAQSEQLNDSEINVVLLSDDAESQRMHNQALLSLQSSDKQSPCLLCKLIPLDMDESHQLLTHCLTQLGYNAKIEHQDALTQQLRNCQGNPEKILALAEKVSVGKLSTTHLSWFKTRFPALALMMLLVLLATGLTFYLYPRFIAPQSGTVKAHVATPTLSTAVDLMPPPAPSSDVLTSTEPLAGEWNSHQPALPETKLSVGEADSQQAITLSEQQLNVLDIAADSPALQLQQAVVEEKPVALHAELVSHNIAQSDAVATDQQTLQPVNPSLISQEVIAVESEPESVAQQVSSSIVNSDENSELMTTTEQLLVVENKDDTLADSVAEKAVEQENTANVGYHKDDVSMTPSAQLFAVNENFYTLQLAALSSKESLQEFIAEFQLADKDIYLYRKIVNKKNWYMVIYGQFENRKLALMEAQKLSNSFAKLDSWAKKYASVHQDLQLNE